MATDYPGSLDSFPEVGSATPMDTSGSEHHVLHNDMADAIVALETELGVNPSASYTTVAERLDAIGTGGGSGNANIAYGTEPVSPEVGEFWLDTNSPPETEAPSYAALGNGGTSKTIDIMAADVQTLTLNQSTCTLTFTGTPAADTVRWFVLRLVHDGTTSSRTVVWPAGTLWVNGTAPFLPTTLADAVAMVSFLTLPDGTLHGFHTGNFYP